MTATTNDLGTLTKAELSDQPRAWRRAAELAFDHGPLNGLGERWSVIGCGTSYYVGGAFAQLREAAGLGEADAFIASSFPVNRAYDRLLSISRSGTTRDLVTAMTASHHPGGRTGQIAITGTPGSPVTAIADEVVDLSFADERSVVQTRFATTALAYLRARLGTDIEPLAIAAEEALKATLPPLGQYDHFVFLGRGWGSWLAAEAALKMREMSCAKTEAYLDVEYEHGPLSVAGPSTLVWSLGGLTDEVRSAVGRSRAAVIDSSRDPMVELVLIHRYALEFARLQGIDCDHPRYLNRSVT